MNQHTIWSIIHTRTHFKVIPVYGYQPQHSIVAWRASTGKEPVRWQNLLGGAK